MLEENKVSPVSAPQKPRSFISGLLHFFSRKKKKKKGEEENLIDIDQPKPGEKKEPVTLPPVKPQKKIPAKPRPQKPKKREVKKPTPRMDSKGFRVLTDEHDLYRLFTEKNKGKRYDEDDDFARLFEKSQQDRRQRLMMKEKKGALGKPNTTPLTPRERIKVYPAPQRELDLHGFTAVQAETRTEAFIRGARQNDIRTVRIIVGKGRHSNGKAVLPDLIEKKIIELKGKQWVLAFKWEKKDKRKSGAIIVYLLPDRNPL